jgi:hypothetical protein
MGQSRIRHYYFSLSVLLVTINKVKEWSMKKIAALILGLSGLALSGGHTNWSQVQQLQVVRDQGIVIRGSAFGNPHGCEAANALYVSRSHPQYAQIVSVVLTAITAKMQIQGYSQTCTQVGWFSSNEDQFNELEHHSTLYLKL